MQYKSMKKIFIKATYNKYYNILNNHNKLINNNICSVHENYNYILNSDNSLIINNGHIYNNHIIYNQ
jgi:hypothetical protein